VTPLQLVAHVNGDLVQGDVSRSFVHDLDVLFPGTKSEFTLKLELGELSFVVGIIDRSRSKTVTNGKGNIIFRANTELSDFLFQSRKPVTRTRQHNSANAALRRRSFLGLLSQFLTMHTTVSTSEASPLKVTGGVHTFTLDATSSWIFWFQRTMPDDTTGR
jgi:hypothetical protein